MNEQGTLEPVNPRGWFPASVTVHFPPDHLLLHSMADNSAGAPQDQYEQIVVSSAIFRHTCSAMLSTDAVYRAPRTIFRFTRACTAEVESFCASAMHARY